MTERCKRNPCCGDYLDCKPPTQFKPRESYEDYQQRLSKPASEPAGGDVGDSVALSMDSDMRNSDFETWACKRGYLMHLHEGDESRRYRYSLTEEAWLGWCAALSQSTSAGRVGE